MVDLINSTLTINSSLDDARPSPSYLTQIPIELYEKLSSDQKNALRTLEWQFDVSKSKLSAVVDHFLEEFTRGLAQVPSLTDTHNHNLLPMIPTFIHDVPTGDEQGIFLALDLGGTNLRVCEVNLNGDKTFTIKSNKYKLSDEVKTGTAAELFGFIAECVETFLVELGHDLSSDERLHLGFTFSFPAHQTALDKGRLIAWTKGFKASGTIGNDVVKLLQDALDSRGLQVHCNALVNDTTGTLMARAYQSGSAVVGAIFGTGTNGAYVENLEKVKKLTNKSQKFNHMIINTEWGAFDNDRKVLPVTKYDNKLDRLSINPRKQAFEKMISGMYLGELSRNIILDFLDNLIIFQGLSSGELNTHYGIDTALMSAIELAHDHTSASASLESTKKIITNSFGVQPSDADCVMIQRICEVVATRAARLSATAIATIIRQTDPKGTLAIGVDGSVIEHYPKFQQRMMGALTDLFDKSVCDRLVIGLAKDGSGVGAALCALQAKKQADSL
ncbi:hexokinase-domain-containing protein [Melampsora americana]|nr:hexokinase-domain-containing protein [Melampsora americana]